MCFACPPTTSTKPSWNQMILSSNFFLETIPPRDGRCSKSWQEHEQPPFHHTGFAHQFVPCDHFIKNCEWSLQNEWNGPQNTSSPRENALQLNVIELANASCLPRSKNRMGASGAVGSSPTSSPATDTPTMLMVSASESQSSRSGAG